MYGPVDINHTCQPIKNTNPTYRAHSPNDHWYYKTSISRTHASCRVSLKWWAEGTRYRRIRSFINISIIKHIYGRSNYATNAPIRCTHSSQIEGSNRGLLRPAALGYDEMDMGLIGAFSAEVIDSIIGRVKGGNRWGIEDRCGDCRWQ